MIFLACYILLADTGTNCATENRLLGPFYVNTKISFFTLISTLVCPVLYVMVILLLA